MGWQDAPEVTEPEGQPAFQAAPEVGGQQTPAPSMGEVALNAVPKGAANLVNTPVMLRNLLIRGLAAMPGMEQFPELKQHLEGVIENPSFGRNYPMEGMEQLGLVDPAKEPQTGPQRIVDLAIQSAVGAAAFPAGGAMGAAKAAGIGAASGTAAGVTKEATRDLIGERGSDILAAVVGMGTPVMAKLWANSVAQKGNKSILNEPSKMTLKDAREHGYVVEPSKVRQPSSVLETVAGKASIAQEASIRNQAVTNSLAARSLGLPGDTPLSMSILEEVRKRAAEPYEEVAKLVPGGQLQGLKVTSERVREMQPGPATGLKVTRKEGPAPTTGVSVREIRDDAGNLIGLKTVKQSEGTTGPLEGLKAKVTSRGEDVPGPLQGLRVNVQEARGGIPLEELKQARSDANAFYRHYDRSADPASLKAANEAMAKAHALEAEIEETVTRLGRSDLVDKLRDARQLIARTHDIERAMNLATGDISAQAIGRMLDKGKAFTGELLAIAKFAQAFPRAARDIAGVPPAGVSGTDAAMAATLGGIGAAASGSATGLAAAGLPLLRGPARSHVLSKGYQDKLLKEGAKSVLDTPAATTAGASAMTGKTVADNAEDQ